MTTTTALRNTARIAELNDIVRKRCMVPTFDNQGIRHRVVYTPGITALSPESQINIAASVREFNDFSEENDPYGERDFGAFDYEGRRIFWKIDYYAPDMCHGSEDPADLAQTVRVLTIMLAFEY